MLSQEAKDLVEVLYELEQRGTASVTPEDLAAKTHLTIEQVQAYMEEIVEAELAVHFHQVDTTTPSGEGWAITSEGLAVVESDGLADQ